MADKTKSKGSLKVILTILTIVVVGLVCYLFVYFAKATTDGTITVIVENYEGEVLSEEDIRFSEGDTLIELIKKEYDDSFKYNDGAYGAYVTSIGGIEELNEATYVLYISMYVNDEYSEYGLSTLPFEDGDVITFKLERYDYQ